MTLDNQESLVNAAKMPSEDLRDKFEPPLTLIATQGFISDDNSASYASDNSYFNNLLSFYVAIQDKRDLAVAKSVSFSNTKVSSKDQVEHMLTKN